MQFENTKVIELQSATVKKVLHAHLKHLRSQLSSLVLLHKQGMITESVNQKACVPYVCLTLAVTTGWISQTYLF